MDKETKTQLNERLSKFMETEYKNYCDDAELMKEVDAKFRSKEEPGRPLPYSFPGWESTSLKEKARVADLTLDLLERNECIRHQGNVAGRWAIGIYLLVILATLLYCYFSNSDKRCLNHEKCTNCGGR